MELREWEGRGGGGLAVRYPVSSVVLGYPYQCGWSALLSAELALDTSPHRFHSRGKPDGTSSSLIGGSCWNGTRPPPDYVRTGQLFVSALTPDYVHTGQLFVSALTPGYVLSGHLMICLCWH